LTWRKHEKKLCLIRQCLIISGGAILSASHRLRSAFDRHGSIEARNMHIEIVSSLFRILGPI